MDGSTTNSKLQLNYAEQAAVKRAATIFREGRSTGLSASDHLAAKKAAAIAASVTSPLSSQGATISGLRRSGC
jgi:hypothetical protein